MPNIPIPVVLVGGFVLFGAYACQDGTTGWSEIKASAATATFVDGTVALECSMSIKGETKKVSCVRATP